MRGYGGNLVVLLPNGVSVFRFADAGSSDVESMILAGEAIRPLCAPSATAAVAPPRAAMTAGELRAELVGRTFDSGASTIAVDRSGVVTVDAKGDVDVGRWQHHRRRPVLPGVERGRPRPAALLPGIPRRRGVRAPTRSTGGR